MSARDRILASLRSSLEGTTPIPDPFDASLVDQPWRYSAAERITRLQKIMTAVHSEVHLTSALAWPQLLSQLLAERQITRLLLAPNTEHGKPSARIAKPSRTACNCWPMIVLSKNGSASSLMMCPPV